MYESAPGGHNSAGERRIQYAEHDCVFETEETKGAPIFTFRGDTARLNFVDSQYIQ
jgi:hypothetical protein